MVARTPRPHQVKSVALLRAAVGEGRRRPLLQLPTGAGKTVTAAMVIESFLAKDAALARRDGRPRLAAIFAVPALSLIDQTVREFGAEGLEHVGVIQADHPMRDLQARVQVVSLQTLTRRGVGYLPPAGVVLIDEAHKHFEITTTWMNTPGWEKVPFVGLSATPWAKGLGRHYDPLIVGATVQELIAAGYLCRFEVFAPDHPDLKGVRVKAGEYDEGQLAEVMGEAKLVANVVANWLEHGEGRPTLCFAVNRAHARKLEGQFTAAGVPCGYVDALTPPAEREAVRQQFASGELKVVANVGVLTTGVDWDVRCIIMARPVRSEMLFVQCIGRGLRTAPGKQNCRIFDHSDNTLRLGFVTDIHHEALDDGKQDRRGKRDQAELVEKPRECAKCRALRPPKVKGCPACGFEPRVQSDIEERDGRLARVGGAATALPPVDTLQAWYSGLLHIRNERRKKEGYADAIFKNKFGAWPSRFPLSKVPMEPLPEVRDYVKSRHIRYHKQKEAMQRKATQRQEVLV